LPLQLRTVCKEDLHPIEAGCKVVPKAVIEADGAKSLQDDIARFLLVGSASIHPVEIGCDSESFIGSVLKIIPQTFLSLRPIVLDICYDLFHFLFDLLPPARNVFIAKMPGFRIEALLITRYHIVSDSGHNEDCRYGKSGKKKPYCTALF
jgi:hypothetical protein